MTVSDCLTAFVGYLTMAYHEARNVRHLVRKGHLDKAPYRLLIDSLSSDRDEAWRQIQGARGEALRAQSAGKAEAVFRRRFGLSLENLVTLSRDEHWSGSRMGGNRWAEIDEALIDLRDALDDHDAERSSKLVEEIPLMRHNTGFVSEKLQSLDDKLSDGAV